MEIEAAFELLSVPESEADAIEVRQAWRTMMDAVERSYASQVHSRGGALNRNEQHREDIVGRVLAKLIQRWREGRLESREGRWTQGRCMKYLNDTVRNAHVDVVRQRRAQKRDVQKTTSLFHTGDNGDDLELQLSEESAARLIDDDVVSPEQRLDAMRLLEKGRHLLEQLAVAAFEGARRDRKATREQAFSQLIRRTFDGHDMHEILKTDEGLVQAESPDAWRSTQARWLKTHQRVRMHLEETLDRLDDTAAWPEEDVELCRRLLPELRARGD